MIFPDIKGNENLKKSLTELEEHNRMPHAVIIDGGSAETREALAEHLAMWAVCGSDSEKPCGKCKGCILAKAKSHGDIYYAKEDGKTKIYKKDEIINIEEDSVLKPYISDTKVYIFYDCDKKLPVISQNTFLKTLEEPPQDTLFIMTCESSKSLLETIRSRCVVFTLEGEQSFSEENTELAEKIAEGIVARSEMELLKATNKLDSRDKALETLEILTLLLRDGLAVYLGAKAELNGEIAEKLCKKLTKKNYLDLIDITDDARLKVTQNVGLKLVSTTLCARYRRALWQR